MTAVYCHSNPPLSFLSTTFNDGPCLLYCAAINTHGYVYISDLDPISTPRCFTHISNHARRPRLKKLLCLGLSRGSGGFFKVLLDSGGGFASKTTVSETAVA